MVYFGVWLFFFVGIQQKRISSWKIVYRGNSTRQSPQPKFKAKELKVYFVIIHCCAYDIHCVAVSTEKRDKQIISLAQWLPFTSCHFIWLLLFLLSVVFQFWCGYLLLLQLRFDWRYFLLETHTHFCIETTISVFKFNQSLWWGGFFVVVFGAFGENGRI